jgi:hypothetical protein
MFSPVSNRLPVCGTAKIYSKVCAGDNEQYYGENLGTEVSSRNHGQIVPKAPIAYWPMERLKG